MQTVTPHDYLGIVTKAYDSAYAPVLQAKSTYLN